MPDELINVHDANTGAGLRDAWFNRAYRRENALGVGWYVVTFPPEDSTYTAGASGYQSASSWHHHPIMDNQIGLAPVSTGGGWF
jgi:hypothetical protein